MKTLQHHVFTDSYKTKTATTIEDILYGNLLRLLQTKTNMPDEKRVSFVSVVKEPSLSIEDIKTKINAFLVETNYKLVDVSKRGTTMTIIISDNLGSNKTINIAL